MAGMAIGWVVFRVRATPSDLGLTHFAIRAGRDPRRDSFLAAILPVGQIQKYLVENVIPYNHPLIKAVKHQPDAWMLSVVSISAIIVAPFAEELFFRVLMQGCFEAVEAKRRWLLTLKRSSSGSDQSPQANGTSVPQTRPIPTGAELAALSGPATWPIVVTSVVFALMHAGQGAAPDPLVYLLTVSRLCLSADASDLAFARDPHVAERHDDGHAVVRINESGEMTIAPQLAASGGASLATVHP